MADALGVAASIVAVATAGFQVAQALYQIAEGIGGAGREVRVYAKEVAVFSKVLNNIRNAILRPDVKSAELSLVKDITDICEDVLEPLNRIRKTLESLLERYRDSKRKLEQLKQRIHWYFSKRNKLLFYREALRGHQQNLDTVLAAMNFNATRDM
jgi:predicted nuclease with TOPRIM domain